MEQAITWITGHWLNVVGILWIADKVAKATPTKYDDFCVEVLGDFLRIITGRKKVD